MKQNPKIELLSDFSFIGEPGFYNYRLWLKPLAGKCKLFLICTAHRPPSTSIDCFDAEFSDAFISTMSLNKAIYILGDLNCNLLKPFDRASQAFLNFFTLCNLIQTADSWTDKSYSIICNPDWCHLSFEQEREVMSVSISDHDLVFAFLKLKRQRP